MSNILDIRSQLNQDSKFETGFVFEIIMEIHLVYKMQHEDASCEHVCSSGMNIEATRLRVKVTSRLFLVSNIKVWITLIFKRGANACEMSASWQTSSYLCVPKCWYSWVLSSCLYICTMLNIGDPVKRFWKAVDSKIGHWCPGKIVTAFRHSRCVHEFYRHTRIFG